MIRIPFALTGALAALVFSAATAYADTLDEPTPIGDLSGPHTDGYTWWLDEQEVGHQDFTLRSG